MFSLLIGRRALVITFQAALVVLSNYAAFWLRFDGDIPYAETMVFYRMIGWIVAIRVLMFLPFKLYEGLWRYTGIWDLLSIIKSVCGSSLIIYALIHGFYRQSAYPRSVYIIDSILLVCLMGGARITRRFYREIMSSKHGKRVLIFGAGDAAEMIVRDMKKYGEYVPVGFVDDDAAKVGQRIHGVAVLGTRHDLPVIMTREKPQEVLVAIPRGDPSTVRSVVMALETYKVPITTLPALREILNGKVVVDQIRQLSIEDLLPRAPVGLDPTRVSQLIAGRRVMVTGAGGSIGSELCRQIARFEPSELILFERYENGLYDIVNDLLDREFFPPISSVIGDVTDRKRLDAVMSDHRPQLVFHAAAHKHVPLMEHNPCEAVKNNVTGTRMVAEGAKRHGAELFVLISTDKAVNPSSIMGATKRVAELILQHAGRTGPTSFVTVRFGNVLGSNGSLVPRFLQQISAGGPVTVTHPDIRRYFMLIPEAVQLVLHAAAMGQNGGMYTLEMGDQIKVLDMARNLIRLSGFVPDEEIPIMFIGLRPGEKLSEELVGADEIIEGSAIEKILRVRTRHDASDTLVMEKVTELERLAAMDEPAEVARQLARILPNFRPEAEARSRASKAEGGLRPVVVSGYGDGRRTVVRFPQPPTMFADRRDPALRTRRKHRGGGRRLTDMITVAVDGQPISATARV